MAQKTTAKKKATEQVIEIDLQPYVMPLALILAAVIFSVSLLIGLDNIADSIDPSDKTQKAAVRDNTADEAGDLGDEVLPTETGSINIDDDAYTGDIESATVAIVEFSDFNCSFCTRHHTEGVYDQIISEYVETGDAIFVYRDFPGVGGQTTADAAAAAECVRAQTNDETYLSLISDIYNSSDPQRNVETVKSLAENYDVNSEELNTCIEAGTYQDEVSADLADAQAQGIGGTPSFVIGTLKEDGTVDGEVFVGAQPFENFAKVIESYL